MIHEDATAHDSDDDTIRAMSADTLREVLDRFAALGVRFKWDVPPTTDSLGLVVGVNRGIYTTQDPVSGELTIERSSDAGLGGHLADPSDTQGARLPDGRWRWAADCELAIVRIASCTPQATPHAGIRVDPSALPSWTNRPVVRRYTARSWSMLRLIRDASGDADVQPFTYYVRADASGPIAIGAWPDARTWGDADWRLSGQPVGLEALGPDGQRHPLGRARGIHAVVASVATHLRDWANPDDPSMQGPRRGRRTPKPVQSAPGLVLVVGKDGDELMATDDDPADQHEVRLTYGTAAGDELRARAGAVGIRELARRTGIAYETVRTWIRGGRTNAVNLARIEAAVRTAGAGDDAEPRRCALNGCDQPVRAKSAWCSAAHNKTGRRRRATPIDPTAQLPACPECRTRFINPIAAQRHQCERQHRP
jgi:hypothetical protein